VAFGALSAIMNVWQWTVAYSGAVANPKLSANTFKAALFNNTTTPDNTALVLTPFGATYNTGPWVVANEVTDVTNWVAGGRALGTPSSPPATYAALAYVMFDAADTAGGGNVTLANVYGDLVYDPSCTPANLAVAYHSYGGSAQGVTAGTFTIIWHVNGVARWTHTPA
jgi:hypothetical protein